MPALTPEEIVQIREMGSLVTYQEADGLERAMADVEGDAWLRQDAELIPENLDPYKVQARNLAYLAFHHGVTLWYEDWPEWKKRRWIAEQPLFKSLVGTEAALRMALDIVDAKLVQVVRPPQGMFYSGSVDPAERAAYLARLPELRIYTGRDTRPYDGGLIWADGFWSDGFFREDIGTELYGRRATYIYKGVEVPLKHIAVSYRDTDGSFVNFEKIVKPGDPGDAVFYGATFYNDTFYNAMISAPETYTLATDGRFTITTAQASVSVIAPTFQPLYPYAEKGSIYGDPGEALFYSAECWNDRYFTPDDAEDLTFTRIRLFDPDEPAPTAPFGDFYNDARYGIPMFTAEILVDATRPARDGELFFGDGFLNEGGYVPPDFTPQDRAEAAILAAKKMTDRILWSFQTTRELALTDTIPIDGSYNFRNRIPRNL